MKLIYIILFGLFLFTSCTTDESTSDGTVEEKGVEIKISEDGNDESSVLSKIAYQWILTNRTNTQKDKSVDYSKEAPSIITHFETNGFFSTFDLIEINTDNGKSQTLEARSSGQWEIHNDNELVMHHSFNDSAIVESFIIEKLDDKELIIKNSEKDMIDTYQRKD